MSGYTVVTFALCNESNKHRISKNMEWTQPMSVLSYSVDFGARGSIR